MIGPGEGFDEEDEELVVETESRDLDLEDLEILIDTRYEGEILPTVEAAIMAKWSKIMGPDCNFPRLPRHFFPWRSKGWSLNADFCLWFQVIS